MQRITEKPFNLPIGKKWPDYRYNLRLMQNIKSERRKLKKIITLIHVHPCYLQNYYLGGKEEDRKLFKGFLKSIYPNNFIANVSSTKYGKKPFSESNSEENLYVCQEKERVNFLMISFLAKSKLVNR